MSMKVFQRCGVDRERQHWKKHIMSSSMSLQTAQQGNSMWPWTNLSFPNSTRKLMKRDTARDIMTYRVKAGRCLLLMFLLSARMLAVDSSKGQATLFRCSTVGRNKLTSCNFVFVIQLLSLQQEMEKICSANNKSKYLHVICQIKPNLWTPKAFWCPETKVRLHSKGEKILYVAIQQQQKQICIKFYCCFSIRK